MSESTVALSVDQFPILSAATNSPNRFRTALEDIATGVRDGAIRNTVLNEAKYYLSRAASDGWEKTVSDPYFHAGAWKTQPQDVQDLGDAILIMSLHDVIGASKKVNKSTASGPAVDAMRAYCAEVLPLALSVASLKEKVLKGRAPRPTKAKPVNPDKLVQTCPVCFRQIAVLRGTMAHHGYKRPGAGWQTASCPGVRFKPLEVSSEGLKWLTDVLRERLRSLESTYETRESKQSLMVERSRRQGGVETITRDSPQWHDHFRVFVANLQAEIRAITSDLPMLEKRLADWQPIL